MGNYTDLLSEIRKCYTDSGGLEGNLHYDSTLDSRLKYPKVTLSLTNGFPYYFCTPDGGVRVVNQVVKAHDTSYDPHMFINLIRTMHEQRYKGRKITTRGALLYFQVGQI